MAEVSRSHYYDRYLGMRNGIEVARVCINKSGLFTSAVSNIAFDVDNYKRDFVVLVEFYDGTSVQKNVSVEKYGVHPSEPKKDYLEECIKQILQDQANKLPRMDRMMRGYK